jgi:hypothetical protein
VGVMVWMHALASSPAPTLRRLRAYRAPRFNSDTAASTCIGTHTAGRAQSKWRPPDNLEHLHALQRVTAVCDGLAQPCFLGRELASGAERDR